MSTLSFRDTTLTQKVLGAASIFFTYQTLKLCYRLYFHPLSKFPGPRKAALSRWYGLYFDAFKNGRYGDMIEQMHQRYGPIVRIGPDELHIMDSSYYDTIFNFNPQLDKPAFATGRFPYDRRHELHRKRRKNIESYFSRASIHKSEDVIQKYIEKACLHLDEARQSGKPINAGTLLRAITVDVICEICFGHPYDSIDNMRESEAFFESNSQSFKLVYFVRDIKPTSWLLIHVSALPAWMLPKDEGLQAGFRHQEKIKHATHAAVTGQLRGEIAGRPTIFDEYHTADLPPSEKTEEKQFLNAFLLVAAGFETTGYTLSTAVYHLLANPDMTRKLKQELSIAWPDPTVIPSWSTLEKLPYLKAVLQESLRMSIGAMHRLSRVNHKAEMQYGDWIIPKHTIISMSQRFVLYDPEIFPDPSTFDPSRWLQGEKSAPLEKHLVSFSRGSRGCLGMQLAWAEMYMSLGTIFRRFDLELFETARVEVDPVYDHFIPVPKSSKGVRVVVK